MATPLTFKLDGVEYGAGPGTFAPRWTPRRQKFEGPGSWTAIQDFGQPIGDLVWELGSGNSGQLTTAEKAAITALSRAPGGGPYDYEDAFGNVGTVVIMDFQPSFFQAGLWNYTLVLQVRTATVLDGVAE